VVLSFKKSANGMRHDEKGTTDKNQTFDKVEQTLYKGSEN
jgi:hypothetical protein